MNRYDTLIFLLYEIGTNYQKIRRTTRIDDDTATATTAINKGSTSRSSETCDTRFQ